MNKNRSIRLSLSRTTLRTLAASEGSELANARGGAPTGTGGGVTGHTDGQDGCVSGQASCVQMPGFGCGGGQITPHVFTGRFDTIVFRP